MDARTVYVLGASLCFSALCLLILSRRRFRFSLLGFLAGVLFIGVALYFAFESTPYATGHFYGWPLDCYYDGKPVQENLNRVTWPGFWPLPTFANAFFILSFALLIVLLFENISERLS